MHPLSTSGSGSESAANRVLRARMLAGVLPPNDPIIGGFGEGDARRRIAVPWEPGGRLTATTGTSVTTADVTAVATLYYTSDKHNVLPGWTGKDWAPYSFDSDLVLSVSGISNATAYDVFGRVPNWGRPDLALGPAWSSGTARSVALSTKQGRLVLSSDQRLIYLGTIYASGSGITEDSTSRRFVWNCYNRRWRSLTAIDTTSSWTYTTNTFREARAQSTDGVSRFALVLGLSEDSVEAISSAAFTNSNVPVFGEIGIGLDSTTTTPATCFRVATHVVSATNIGAANFAHYIGYPGIGYHFLARLERSAAAGTMTWYGSSDSNEASRGPGMTGRVAA